jgi:hypothetical protein
MMIHYKSDYPNQVQQMNISISQHYYLLKDGTIKWQEKKFDINWKNYSKTNKRHLVTYIIRDHFSSCFYAEFHPIDEMPKIEDFLFNAWKLKDDYAFHGIGKTVMIPQSTLDQFPRTINFFKNVTNIHLQIPTSGFSSAVRSIREWEQKIKFVISYIRDIDKIKGFKNRIEKINEDINNQYLRDDSNLKKWINNNPKIISPGDKETFIALFNDKK